jgi:Kef-type K+ transport system membrane component KefB
VSAHALGLLLLGLAAIIVLSRLFGALARRVGQPPVIGEIVAGILVGPTLFGTLISDRLFPVAEVRPALSGLANVGLVLFMFIVGYELDHTLVRGRERVAVSVSVGSIALPFGLGAVLALWLAGRHGVTDTLPFVLFIGAAMSVTAFPVLARILTDRGMHRTAVGGLALASAAVDDVIAWTLLAVVIAIGGADSATWHTALAVPYVLLMFFVVRPQLRRLIAARDKAGRMTPNILAVVLVGLLLSCYAAEWLGVHAIFGAFVFGAVMPRAGGERLRHEILERLEQVSVLLLLPVFFFLSGLRVDLSQVDVSGLLELALILSVAIVGKFAGAFLGARLQRVPARQAGALATLMNTRGLTEIVILTVGLQLGILDTSLFSLMVVMALVTTVMAGPLLTLIYPQRRIDRDVAEAERAALGAPEAYRVQALLDGARESTVEVAAALVGPRRPGEVVLSQLVPYAHPGRLEVGTGLSGELMELAGVMEELERLAGPLRARGVDAAILARLSADLPRDLSGQLAAAGTGTLVVGKDHLSYERVRAEVPVRLVTIVADPPVPWAAVVVRPGSGPDWTAAAQVGAQLAASVGVEVVFEADGRPGRRLQGLVEELRRHGVAARAGAATGGLVVASDSGLAVASDGGLVVASDNGSVEGAHLVVRSEREPTELAPAEWVPQLAVGSTV